MPRKRQTTTKRKKEDNHSGRSQAQEAWSKKALEFLIWGLKQLPPEQRKIVVSEITAKAAFYAWKAKRGRKPAPKPTLIHLN